MKQLVERIVVALVDSPEVVRVEDRSNEESDIFEIHVDPSDVGKVIGKEGRIANAIRTVAKAAIQNRNRKISIEIASNPTSPPSE
ncbi:KH domain-containing protein [bacterium]|nr:KH domain-containing protein [bacterium]